MAKLSMQRSSPKSVPSHIILTAVVKSKRRILAIGDRHGVGLHPDMYQASGKRIRFRGDINYQSYYLVNMPSDEYDEEFMWDADWLEDFRVEYVPEVTYQDEDEEA